MSRYFESINNGQKVVVDDKYKRMSMLRVVSLNDTDYIGGTNFGSYAYLGNMASIYTFQLQLNDNEHLVALKPNYKDDDVVFIIRSVRRFINQQNKNCLDIHLVHKTLSEVPSTYAQNVYIYIYGEADAQTVSNIGLVVYDANGEQLYHSNQYLLDIQGSLKAEHQYNSNGSTNDFADFKISDNGDLALVVNLLPSATLNGSDYPTSIGGISWDRPIGIYGASWKNDGYIHASMCVQGYIMTIHSGLWAQVCAPLAFYSDVLLVNVTNAPII